MGNAALPGPTPDKEVIACLSAFADGIANVRNGYSDSIDRETAWWAKQYGLDMAMVKRVHDFCLVKGLRYFMRAVEDAQLADAAEARMDAKIAEAKSDERRRLRDLLKLFREAASSGA